MVDYELFSDILRRFLLNHSRFLGTVQKAFSACQAEFKGYTPVEYYEVVVCDNPEQISDRLTALTPEQVGYFLEDMLCSGQGGPFEQVDLYFAVRVFPEYCRYEINLTEAPYRKDNSFTIFGKSRIYMRLYTYKKEES